MPLLGVIALGGVLGSLARVAIAEALGPWHPDHLPWATLLVNVLGCLAIGLAVPLIDHRPSRPWLRPFLVTGVLGGFTTFSALAVETGLLLDGGEVALAAGYVVLTLAAGLAAVAIGSRIAGGGPDDRASGDLP